jgi:hypothetical protein
MWKPVHSAPMAFGNHIFPAGLTSRHHHDDGRVFLGASGSIVALRGSLAIHQPNESSFRVGMRGWEICAG